MTDEPKKSNVTCKRYNFKYDDDINWCDRSNVPSSQSHSTESDTNSTTTRQPINGHRVVPRSVGYSSMIGSRHLIKCVARGQELDDSEFISLCASCWAWRELPSDYFPRYINELICMDGDHRCLSGYGTCQTGIHTATVLKNVSGMLQPVNINTAAYCECKAQVGSPVYGIVMG
ncbi:unnamed protein product [Toxocara canis]|uniref:Activin_recp domain-containing protein n=1 Tax=Toxocara canis TaxID=6265 RepID=A0A183U3I2_TOXCA|nr:unnamed protein product [Toxocara canis]